MKTSTNIQLLFYLVIFYFHLSIGSDTILSQTKKQSGPTNERFITEKHPKQISDRNESPDAVSESDIDDLSGDNSDWKLSGFIRELIQGSESSLHPDIRPVKYPAASRSTLGLASLYEKDKLKLDLQLRGDYIFSNYNDSPAFDAAWNRRIRDRFFYLEYNHRTDSYINLIYVHRMYATYNGEKTKITLGRQAISWGQGRFLNPLDLITPVGPFVIDIEDIPGADAINAVYYINSLNMIEGVIAPYRRYDRPNLKKIYYRDTNTLIRFKGTAGNLDYFTVAGYHFHSWVWGFDLNYTVFGASFRFAYLLRGESKLRDYPYYADDLPPIISHQAVMGASYTFFKKIQTNFEVFANSAYYLNDPALKENMREENTIAAGFQPPANNDGTFFRVSGRIITKNPVLFEASIGYAATDLLNVSVFAIGDPIGRSAMFGPSFSYSLSDEAVLSFGAWTFSLPSDRERAEFGDAEPMAFMYLRWHF